MKEEKYIIPRYRKALPVPCLWNGINQSHPDAKKIHGAMLKQQWNSNKDGKFYAINVKKDWDRVGLFIKDRLVNEEDYLKNTYKKQLELGEELVNFSNEILKTDLNKKETKELLELYGELQEKWLVFDRTNVPAWFMGGDFFQEHIQNEIKKIATSISDEEFTKLITTPEPSFSALEELGIFKILKEIKEKKSTDFEQEETILKKIDKLVEEYYWIPFGYDGPTTYDRKHYIKTIKELLEKDASSVNDKISSIENYEENTKASQKNIIKKYNIPDELNKLIKQTHTMALMTDQRKEFTFQGFVALHKIFDALAKKLNILPIVFKYVLIEEVRENLNSLEKLLKIYEKRKNETFFIHFFEGKTKFIYGEEAEKLGNEMTIKSGNESTLKGVVASKGETPIITAKAKVLMSPQELSKINKGDILVATMTSPEFVPGMRISSAIITDEGGVTCHAAIVSRELGIPCIIGTKTATRIIKDNDLVEIDTDKRTIKILEKK